MMLSTKAREAIKTALAMTIAYGIALSLDWERPYWAGFAVAFVSLSTIGQSLNKAVLRMLGTLMAVAVALTLIALFPQERWPFMVFLSTYVGFCTYMFAGSKRPYFWFVGGLVCVIVCMDGGVNSVNAFQTAVLRAQETGLGILVYSLVSVFLWPTSTRAGFEAATCKLAATRHQLYRSYLDLMSGRGKGDAAQALRVQEIQERTRFDQLLDGAASDSYEVWELRRPWRRFQGQAAALMETLERWRESFKEVQGLALGRLLPNLDALTAELEWRFDRIEGMLAGHAPDRVPQAVDLSYDKGGVQALSHFRKAAVAVTRIQLQNLEILTRSLFETLQDINGFGPSKPKSAGGDGVRDGSRDGLRDGSRDGSHNGSHDSPHSPMLPDLEGITAAVRVMATQWLAYLAVIYVNDFPGGFGFVSMITPFVMTLAVKPQLPASLLFMPISVSVLFASLVYIFVMPRLSSFAELGPLVFGVTFTICYLFSAPRHALGRAFGLAMFVTIASISNHQTYSFLSPANTALMFVLAFALFSFTAYIPVSTRPEKAFLRLLGRFFRSGEYLISTLRWDPERPMTRLDRWRKAFHAREVSTVPQKLGAWAPHVGTKAQTGASIQPVQAVVTGLQALADRMGELLEVRGSPQAPYLVQTLLADFRAWRLRVQETFKRFSKNPAAGEREVFRTGLAEIMGHLEGRIRVTLDKAADGQLDDRDGENFYSLLGAYRGLSEALVEYAGSAGAIDWASWREERFS